MTWWGSFRRMPCLARLAGCADPERDAGNRRLAGHQGRQGRTGRRSGAQRTAAKAGFEQGDIITAINGVGVDDNRDLTRKVALVASGQSATFTINRQGQVKTIKADIGNRPDDKVASDTPHPAPGPVATGNAMGLGLASLTPEARKTFNLNEAATGVLITKVDPNSDAADKGLQPGDVVQKVGNKLVHTPAEVQSGVAEAQKGRPQERAAAGGLGPGRLPLRGRGHWSHVRSKPISDGEGESLYVRPPAPVAASPPTPAAGRGPLSGVKELHQPCAFLSWKTIWRPNVIGSGLKESGNVGGRRRRRRWSACRWRCHAPMTWPSSTDAAQDGGLGRGGRDARAWQCSPRCVPFGASPKWMSG